MPTRGKRVEKDTVPLSGVHQVTSLLQAWGHGDEGALERLTPIVHGELRKIARKYMAQERRNHTLQPTALINEAYVRLVHMRQPTWQNRVHFFALSAQIMRRILAFIRSVAAVLKPSRWTMRW